MVTSEESPFYITWRQKHQLKSKAGIMLLQKYGFIAESILQVLTEVTSCLQNLPFFAEDGLAHAWHCWARKAKEGTGFLSEILMFSQIITFYTWNFV